MTDPTRRDFMVSAASVAGLALAGPWLMHENVARAATDTKVTTIQAGWFRVGVHGLIDDLVGLQRVSGGKLSVKIKELPGGKSGHRFAYDGARWEGLTFAVTEGPGATKLQQWADKAMKAGGAGNAFRRDISLYLLARDKTTVLRTITMFGCYPVSCNAGDHDTGSAIKSIVFTCNVDRIEEAKG